jgi:hypothetical protein
VWALFCGFGLVCAVLVGGHAAASGSGSGVAAGLSASSVLVENARLGSAAWRVREVRRGTVAGYASQVSVAPGETLALHVSVRPGSRYRVEVYRIGWYGGSGGRLVACLPSCTTGRAGAWYRVGRPDPTTGLLRAGWPVTDRLAVTGGWVSGYYLANLLLTGGPEAGRGSFVPFVVRAPPTRHSAILVQAAVNTWQAYNGWGGRSLYWNHSGVGDDHVSFDRPYDLQGKPLQGGWKANLPQAWEFPLVRFLERYGYDVAYTTDMDTDRDPTELLRHRLVITAGHDEYWTTTMRDAFQAARDRGVNLAFMGANTGYWQMRYADDRRTIVEYRSGGRDPEPNLALKTVRFRDLVPARPECELEGVQYLTPGNGDYQAVIGTPLDPWFKGTGLARNPLLPGLVGYEYDTINENCKTPPLTRLFHASFQGNPNADSVRYSAPSGARVFASGSIRFATALDPLNPHHDQRLQRFMRNALNDLER